jgi:TPR repeat protein
MYDQGQGVPQDNIQAYIWFSLAVERGVKGVKTDRDRVAAKMTAEEITGAQERIREWKPRSGPP